MTNNIRDRILELRRVPAASLRPHPLNWRTHPQAQQDALRGMLAEIGYADALLVRELEEGILQIIDGHLRAETTPHALVPVLVLDLSAEEAALLLAAHDPLASLAGVDSNQLASLLSEVETENAALGRMLAGLLPKEKEDSEETLPDIAIHESFQVVVECKNEKEQQEIYERLTKEGFSCRVLTL